MNPFVEIGLWAIVLMMVPFILEIITLLKLVEKDKRLLLYVSSFLRRSANIYIFISLIYLLRNLLIPILIFMIIEISVGVLLYRNIIKDRNIKKLIINVSITNIFSWIIVYSIFKFVFMNLE